MATKSTPVNFLTSPESFLATAAALSQPSCIVLLGEKMPDRDEHGSASVFERWCFVLTPSVELSALTSLAFQRNNFKILVTLEVSSASSTVTWQ